MTLNIKNAQVAKLLDEVVQLTGETKTEAVRKALEERSQNLAMKVVSVDRRKRLAAFLEDEVWPLVPAELLGTQLTKDEEEAILGYGDSGV